MKGRPTTRLITQLPFTSITTFTTIRRSRLFLWIVLIIILIILTPALGQDPSAQECVQSCGSHRKCQKASDGTIKCLSIPCSLDYPGSCPSNSYCDASTLRCSSACQVSSDCRSGQTCSPSKLCVDNIICDGTANPPLLCPAGKDCRGNRCALSLCVGDKACNNANSWCNHFFPVPHCTPFECTTDADCPLVGYFCDRSEQWWQCNPNPFCTGGKVCPIDTHYCQAGENSCQDQPCLTAQDCARQLKSGHTCLRDTRTGINSCVPNTKCDLAASPAVICQDHHYCQTTTMTCRAQPTCLYDRDCNNSDLYCNRETDIYTCRPKMRCYSHQDCELYETCTRWTGAPGWCAPTCNSMYDCPVGFDCVQGSCLRACTSLVQCAQGEACFEGACVAGCSKSSDCLDDTQSCRNGVCQHFPCTNTLDNTGHLVNNCPSPSTHVCGQFDTCEPQICNGLDIICPLGYFCDEQYDFHGCWPYETCNWAYDPRRPGTISPACFAPTPTCLNLGMAAGSWCVAACSTAADCPKTPDGKQYHACVFGGCVQQCVVNRDCPLGSVCYLGGCVDQCAPEDPNSCHKGFICGPLSRTCVRPCTTTQDCTSGLLCQQNECLPSPLPEICPGCTSKKGWACKNKTCTKNILCLENSTNPAEICEPTEVCFRGRCRLPCSQKCTLPLVIDHATCLCRCPERGECDNWLQVRDPSTCRCGCSSFQIAACSSPRILDPDTCQCGCPSAPCSNPNHQRTLENGCQCSCPNTPCPNGQTRNTSTCECGCPDPTCPNPNHARNAQCKCGCPNRCLAPLSINTTTCQCECRACSSGQTLVDPSQCLCCALAQCPLGSTRAQTGCDCIPCPTTQCPSRVHTRDPRTCQCNCPNAATIQCRAIETFSSTLCSCMCNRCPEGLNLVDSGSCLCCATTQCPIGYTRDINSCTCLENAPGGPCSDRPSCPNPRHTRDPKNCACRCPNASTLQCQPPLAFSTGYCECLPKS